MNCLTRSWCFESSPLAFTDRHLPHLPYQSANQRGAMEHQHQSDNDKAIRSKANIALVVFLLIGAFFLLTEHRAHLAGWIPYWPYLLLLACLLMHLFMHGGHGGHGSSAASGESSEEKK
jgi:hypothetical protein